LAPELLLSFLREEREYAFAEDDTEKNIIKEKSASEADFSFIIGELLY